jgi:ABC-type spermidine/putrescine transport system permease subunit I
MSWASPAGTLVIAAPAIWLTVFFLMPLFVVFGISLATKQFGRPPYSPLLTTEGRHGAADPASVQLPALFTDSSMSPPISARSGSR